LLFGLVINRKNVTETPLGLVLYIRALGLHPRLSLALPFKGIVS